LPAGKLPVSDASFTPAEGVVAMAHKNLDALKY